ncbi:hypothetical protein [Pseudomonas sp. 1152_12]|uniref:hypothetical protein n=1 Tax=Pseudomonas sp. 1152_12 TaxID=2604455 RepID=UPI0040632CBF
MKYRPISRSLERLLKDIYEDSDVSLIEFKKLQAESDRRWEGVIERFGNDSTLVAFQSAMDVTLHLLYLSVDHIKNLELSDFNEAMVKDAVIAQIETARAGAELALKQLPAGPNGLQT